MSLLRKTVLIGAAVASLAATVAMTTAPASAKWGWGWGHHGWGLGALGAGLALGAATTPYYNYDYGYGGCYIARQPVYDTAGNYLGSHRVRVCN